MSVKRTKVEGGTLIVEQHEHGTRVNFEPDPGTPEHHRQRRQRRSHELLDDLRAGGGTQAARLARIEEALEVILARELGRDDT